jgi:hypothetical protein
MSDAEATTLPGTTIATQVKLSPKASQIFLVSNSVLAGFCLALGAGLLFAANGAGWAFLVLAAMLMGGAFWAWHFSQPDVDLQAAVPTTLSLPDGTKVSTDSRTLRSKNAVAGLLQLCEAYKREPLPAADGLVENGLPVPNSEAQAQLQVRQINDEVQAQVANFEALVNGTREGPTVLQSPTQIIPPPDDSISMNHPLA